MSEQWRALSLCAAFPTLPWITDPSNRSRAGRCAMTAVCQVCPVHQDCRAFAEDNAISSGFWAGHERDWRHGTRSVA
jgi:hypothetical protein